MQYTGSRVAFEIFGIPVYWYALCIVFGMALAVYFSAKEYKRIGGKEDDIYDLCLYLLPISIIGARLYYVIFELDRYNNFWEMIDIRSGGLAIHGGVLAGLLVVVLYTKIKKLNFFKIADSIMIFLPMAQGIGRWGNFFNNEAYGYETDLPWALQIDGVGHHPTFLYEFIGNMIIFLTLLYFSRNKRKNYGQTTALYLIMYGIVRFFVEGFRTDSLYLGHLRVAQVISIIFIILGIVLYLVRKNIKEHDENEI